jgi:hypothetical protein
MVIYFIILYMFFIDKQLLLVEDNLNDERFRILFRSTSRGF